MTEAEGAPTPGERLFQCWLDRVRGGEAPDLDALLEGEPADVAREVRDMIGAYEELRRRVGGGGVDASSGRVLGDFRLVREIGRGGVGVVWEAEQLSLGRRVALKLLSPTHSLSGRSEERFRREAEAGARLAHPGIVQVFAVGETDGVHYLAQELVTGGETLADRLASWREAKELPQDHYRGVARLFHSIALALSHAHDGGVIHRDVKPSNLLIANGDEPKVADFGLARVEDELGLSRTGETIGTPFYMSPEQVESRSGGIDHRTDVFSLGATLYEALTLRRPFEGDTSQQVYEKIRRDDPPDPTLLRSRVPRDLAVICMKALEKRPEDRYATMRALADDVGRHLAHEPIAASPPGVVARAVKWSRRHPIVSTSGTVAGVALAVIVGLLLRVLEERDAKDVALKQSRESEASALWQLYVANVHTSSMLALEKGNFRESRTTLDHCPVDHRGWEWRHLDLWLSRSSARVEVEQTRASALAVLPDGRIAATWFDRTTRIWNEETGELEPLPGVDDLANAIAVDPNGRLLVVGTTGYGTHPSGWLVAFDARTLEPLGSWGPNPGGVEAIAFSRDGRKLVVGGDLGLRVWDTETGEELLALDDYREKVTCVAFHPDGERILSGAEDDTVRVFDASTGREVAVLAGHDGDVLCLAVEPAGRLAVSGSADGTARVWDLQTGETIRVYRDHTGPVQAVAIRPDGRRVATGSLDRTVRAWDLDGAPELARHVGDSVLLWREGGVECIAYHPDGERLVYGSFEGTLHALRTRPAAPATTLRGHDGVVNACAFDPAGLRVASGGDDGRVCVWDAQSGDVVAAVEDGREAGRVLSLELLEDGRLFVEHDSGLVRILALDGRELGVLESSPRRIRSIAVRPDGRLLLSGATGEPVQVWDVERGVVVRTLEEREGALGAVCFSPDGTRALTAWSDGAVELWDASSWECVARLEPTNEFVACAAFSADGGLIVFGSNRSIFLWDGAGPPRELEGKHSELVSGVRFGPDGHRIFSCSYDQTLRVWSAETGQPLVVLREHESSVDALDVSADGTRLVSASSDGTLRLWESEADALDRLGRAAEERRRVRPLVVRLLTELGSADAVVRRLEEEADLEPGERERAIRMARAGAD